MAKWISVENAAMWLTKLAAADGEITHGERMVLKSFAETFDVDFNKMLRRSYAISNENEKEVVCVTANEMKGRMFEELVVSFLADKSIYTLLAWRSDKVAGDIYATECLLPDLEIRQKIGDKVVEYFVECKYRSSWDNNGKVDLSKQFLRYRNFAMDFGKELFIVLGVGGTPDHPETFYIIPSRMFNHYHDVPKDRFVPCICSPTAESFQQYISHYFNKRVFKLK